MIVPRPVWIDTDPSVLPGGHEVDDGLALAQAFRSPELRVIGVSSVFGNADLATCHPSAERLVAAFGPAGMAVQHGADRAGAWSPTPATHAIIAAARAAAPASLTMIMLGPITNLAAALDQAPDIAGHLVEIIWVAGRTPGETFRIDDDQATPFPDLNFEKDPAAAAIVLASGVPITLAPWAGSSQLRFRAEHAALLARADAACQSLYRPVSDWLALWQDQWAVDFFMPFDTLAIACAIDRARLGGFAGQARIVTNAGSAPDLIVEAAGKDMDCGGSVWFCNGIGTGFVEELMARITRSA